MFTGIADEAWRRSVRRDLLHVAACIVLAALLVPGLSLWGAYQAGYKQGVKDGTAFVNERACFGELFADRVSRKHASMPSIRYVDRLFRQGWDEGFHAIIDPVLH